MRAICNSFEKYIRTTWCVVVKEELLKQVNCLDLLQEKEASNQLMSFKAFYVLNQHAILANYSLSLSVETLKEKVTREVLLEEPRWKLLLQIVSCLLVDGFHRLNFENPGTIDAILCVFEDADAVQQRFCCSAETSRRSHLSYNQLDTVREHLMPLVEVAHYNTDQTLHLLVRILYNWSEGMVAFMKLKLEVIEIQKRIDQLTLSIDTVSKEWPRKKRFVEQAYKILLLSKLRDKQSKLYQDLDKINGLTTNVKENLLTTQNDQLTEIDKNINCFINNEDSSDITSPEEIRDKMLENATKALNICSDDDPKENEAQKTIMSNIDTTNNKFVDAFPNKIEKINVNGEHNDADITQIQNIIQNDILQHVDNFITSLSDK